MSSPFIGKTNDNNQLSTEMNLAWQGRSIAGPRLRLVEFSAFLEQQLQPDTDSVGVLTSSEMWSHFAHSIIDNITEFSFLIRIQSAFSNINNVTNSYTLIVTFRLVYFYWRICLMLFTHIDFHNKQQQLFIVILRHQCWQMLIFEISTITCWFLENFSSHSWRSCPYCTNICASLFLDIFGDMSFILMTDLTEVTRQLLFY